MNLSRNNIISVSVDGGYIFSFKNLMLEEKTISVQKQTPLRYY